MKIDKDALLSDLRYRISCMRHCCEDLFQCEIEELTEVMQKIESGAYDIKENTP